MALFNTSDPPCPSEGIQRRHRKDRRFKIMVYALVLGTLGVFLALFLLTGLKAVEGVKQTTVSVPVDFNHQRPSEIFENHRHVLAPGALKKLCLLHDQKPNLRETVSLPGVKGQGPSVLNKDFFSQGDSRYPEVAGIKNAIIGSLYLILITLMISLPLGVGSGIYLEELAPKNRFFTVFEVLTVNLAAVPSLIYGLLGLGLFIFFMGFDRSSALTGGLTLSLMALPLLVSSTRQALRNVPKALRDSAIALGAAPVQVVFHHVVPHAFSSLMTGVCLHMARIFGETAPLLVVGLMAFNPVEPQGFTDAVTPLPVQIFMWSRYPEPAFLAKAAAGIVVLILFLLCLTLFALWLRRRQPLQ